MRTRNAWLSARPARLRKLNAEQKARHWLNLGCGRPKAPEEDHNRDGLHGRAERRGRSSRSHRTRLRRRDRYALCGLNGRQCHFFCAACRGTAIVKGPVVFADPHLRGPLALRLAPNGNLLTANGDAVNADPLHPSEIVEFTIWGQFVREYDVDASQGGAFGIDTVLDRDARFNYAVIDDVTNNLLVIGLPVP